MRPAGLPTSRARCRPPGGPPTGDVIGSWAGLQVAFTHVNNIGNEQISRSMYLYEQSDGGGGGALAVTEKVCDLEIDDEAGLIHTRFLADFVHNRPPEPRTATITTGAPAGPHWVLDQHYQTYGVNLVNIETDPLPTDASDSRVTDDDLDGFPGITLLLTGALQGKAYVVQRNFTMLDGTQIDDDHIEGTLSWDANQNYLGSDPTYIKDLNPTTQPDQDPTKRTFQLVRLPSGWGCDEIVAEQCSLFHP